MHFDVHGQNMDITEALHDYVAEKMLEPLKRLIDDPSAKLEVRLKSLNAKDKKNSQVHAHFSAPKDMHFDVTETDEDMYRAVDIAHHRLIEAVRRQLEKRRGH